MKPRRSLIPALAVTAAILSCAFEACGQATDWKEISIPPLHAFHPQEPRRLALPNGMVIFLQEDHELPLIRGVARIRGGSREERADKIGRGEIYGQAWRTGGTRTKTGDEGDDYPEGSVGGSQTAVRWDSTTLPWDGRREIL